jgi:pimeloyl-ACP methyl ester carboxylesterase
MRIRAAILALLLGMVALPPVVPAAASSNALHIAACAQGNTKAAAECGTLRVYENRTLRSGRMILIHFIVLKAKHPTGHLIYVNLGGPASELSAVPSIADGQFFKELTVLRDHYDVLFVDERGFGLSHPIACPLTPQAQPQVYFRQLWPDKLLEQCRMRSVASSDIAQYNTLAAIDDIEDIRAALGYKKLIFDVGSYGTFTAFLYIRRHPESVESAVLLGVVPPGIVNFGRDFAAGSQVSLDRLDADCTKDPMCRKTFPDFRAHFYAVWHRFDRGPISVQVTNPDTHRIQIVALSREVFADAIRHMLYDPEGASYLPYVIDHAYRGDTAPLGSLVQLVTQEFAGAIEQGAFLSYTCSELMPFGNSADDLASARAGSWFGDDRIVAQQRACRIWNVPAMPPSFDLPVRSAIPVLMISGTVDPASPAYEGTRELANLSDAKQMLITDAPHDAESPCTDAAVERFIRSGGSLAGINVHACSGNFKRPPFAATWPPQ